MFLEEIRAGVLGLVLIRAGEEGAEKLSGGHRLVERLFFPGIVIVDPRFSLLDVIVSEEDCQSRCNAGIFS